MNRIVIIGNGFDIAHGLKTSYLNFIEHLKEDFVEHVKDRLCNYGNDVSELFKIVPFPKAQTYNYGGITCDNAGSIKSWDDILEWVKYRYEEPSKNRMGVSKIKITSLNRFLGYVIKESKEKTWGGFENDYKTILVSILKNEPILGQEYGVDKLNSDLQQIITLLYEYLINKINIPTTFDPGIASKIYTKPILKARIADDEVSRYGHIKAIEQLSTDPDPVLEEVLFVNFNYTSTVENYLLKKGSVNLKSVIAQKWIDPGIQTSVRYIHGDLRDNLSDSLIFGYGDEMDEHQAILEAMDNRFLQNIKSVLYTRNPYYREVIDFADAGEFDIIVYGHSCSNTDRTLLNALFEHEKCLSIQPNLHDPNIYTNIYRCFKDKKVMRKKVVDRLNTIQK